MATNIIHPLVSSFVLLSLACSSSETSAPERKGRAAISVSVAPARRDPFPILYRTSGTVRGRNTATLTSKTVGYIRAVNVRSGDAVTAGQALAELEANDSRAGVLGARAALAAALASKVESQAGVEVAASALKLATTTRDRMKSLLEQQAVPQQEFDDADARYQAALAQERMARARLEAVSSNVEQARAAVSENQTMLGYSRILAPFSGRVLERQIDPGALAGPGTPLFVVVDEGALRVETAVEESRVPGLAVGDEVAVELEGLKQPLAGKVSEIVPSVDVASRAFAVKVDLPPVAGTLRPGSFARVAFRVGSEPRLVVPTSAITEFGALDRVFVVERGVARLRMITHGEAQSSWTSVLTGLEEGEQIVATPPPELRDGARVEVKP